MFLEDNFAEDIVLSTLFLYPRIFDLVPDPLEAHFQAPLGDNGHVWSNVLTRVHDDNILDRPGVHSPFRHGTVEGIATGVRVFVLVRGGSRMFLCRSGVLLEG
jgi:hypothetical protein